MLARRESGKREGRGCWGKRLTFTAADAVPGGLRSVARFEGAGGGRGG